MKPQTIRVGNREFVRFLRWPAEVTDGTPRCIGCGQIDEPEYHDMDDCLATHVAARITQSDPFLIPHLLDWAGLGPHKKWGDAATLAVEVAAGAGLIESAADTTLTEKGQKVAAILADMEAQRNDQPGSKTSRTGDQIGSEPGTQVGHAATG